MLWDKRLASITVWIFKKLSYGILVCELFLYVYNFHDYEQLYLVYTKIKITTQKNIGVTYHKQSQSDLVIT